MCLVLGRTLAVHLQGVGASFLNHVWPFWLCRGILRAAAEYFRPKGLLMDALVANEPGCTHGCLCQACQASWKQSSGDWLVEDCHVEHPSCVEMELGGLNMHRGASSATHMCLCMQSSSSSSSTESISDVNQPLTISNGRIIGGNGNPLNLNGVVWGGFDNKVTMLDGLFLGNTSLSLDFATSVTRLAALGFNAVRIPFSFSDLQATRTRNFTRACPTATPAQLQVSF